MSRSKSKSLGFDTIISGVVEGLGKAVIGEVFSRSSNHNSDAYKDVNVIDMKKDDEGCWRIIENE